MVALGLPYPPPVQRMCWGLREVIGEVTGMAALKCINGKVCQHISPCCVSSANEGGTATGETNVRDMLLLVVGAASRSEEL